MHCAFTQVPLRYDSSSAQDVPQQQPHAWQQEPQQQEQQQQQLPQQPAQQPADELPAADLAVLAANEPSALAVPKAKVDVEFVVPQ